MKSLIKLPLFVLIVLCSCTTTKYVPVERVRTEYREADTTAIFNRILKLFESRKEKEVKTDSLIDWTKETVVLNEKGDTTRHNKERIIYRATAREKELETENKTLRDSLSVLNARFESIKTDSVPVPYPVERASSRWEQAKMDLGEMAIGAIGVLFIALMVLIYRFKKIGGRFFRGRVGQG